MDGRPVASGGRTRVLIVDDERMNRALLEATLTHGGYAWTSAEDGLAAWELLDANPDAFDLILLDRRMPRLSGMELLLRIRADERLRYLPVVMQTADSAPEDVVEGIKAGVSYYLAKPLSLQVLLSVVAQAVQEYELLRRLQADLDRQTAALTLLDSGVFRFRTLEEGNMLAVALARSCPSGRNLVVGLSEIFANAVEHGNLAISYHEKSQLLAEGRRTEEITRRLSLPEYSERWVTVEVERLADEIRFVVRDQGGGFDWRKYMNIDPERAFSAHGRGIAMARHLYFDEMTYQGCGNEVVCMVRAPGGRPLSAETSMHDSRAAAEDMAAARTMQMGLLPSVTALAAVERRTGLRITSLYKPSTDIGGDIWGTEALDDHRLALYLADFSGHGVTAALDTIRLDTLIRHMEGDRDRPGTYLTRLNRKLARMLPVGHYCTMIYGVLDTRSSLFTYAAAASSPPLAVDLSSHRVWGGEGKGLPLGISEAAVYTDRQMDVHPGSLLFLFSDALPEARQSNGKPVGCSGVALGLGEALGAGCPTDAPSLIAAILASAEESPRIRDDLTVICCLHPDC